MSEEQPSLTPDQEDEFDRQDKIGRTTHDQARRDLSRTPTGPMPATRRAAGLHGTAEIMNQILPEARKYNAAREAAIKPPVTSEELIELLRTTHPKSKEETESAESNPQ